MECHICSEKISNDKDKCITPCSHTIHTTCYTRWITMGRIECPLCREKILKENIDSDYDDIDEYRIIAENLEFNENKRLKLKYLINRLSYSAYNLEIIQNPSGKIYSDLPGSYFAMINTHLELFANNRYDIFKSILECSMLSYEILDFDRLCACLNDTLSYIETLNRMYEKYSHMQPIRELCEKYEILQEQMVEQMVKNIVEDLKDAKTTDVVKATIKDYNKSLHKLLDGNIYRKVQILLQSTGIN